jgi:nucleoside-triphosphatase THEP1
LITILTGPVGGGKTTYLEAAVPLLRARGLSIDGYLSERVMQGASVSGYNLLDLTTGEEFRLLRRSPRPGGETVGPFAVDPAGFAAAEAVILRSRPEDLLVLDELGRLELAGRGVWPAAEPILMDAGRKALVVIREELLENYLALFRAGGRSVSVFPLPESKEPDGLLLAVAEGRT